MPLRIITDGTRADYEEACASIDGIYAGAFLADRGYDSDEIIEKAVDSGIQTVIPFKRDRKERSAVHGGLINY